MHFYTVHNNILFWHFQVGSYPELQANDGDFAEFLRTYAKEHEDEKGIRITLKDWQLLYSLAVA